jgi:signal transduction histidine kinase/ActR/RegA family two-component response regulator
MSKPRTGSGSNEGAVLESAVEQELLRLLAVQARRVPLPVFLAAAVIAALAYGPFPPIVVATWLVAIVAILILRFFALGWLHRATDIGLPSRLRAATALSAVNGIAHGFASVFFIDLPDFDRSVITITLIGLSAGSVVTTAGYRPVFLAYLLPTLVPLCLMWAVSPGAPFQWRYGSLALLVALLGVVLIVLANDTQRLFRSSFAMRSEQRALNAQLQNALDESRAANSAKTRFLAAASHDLRQPVHALTLLSATLARKTLPADARAIADHIESALEVLGSQLNALLDMSKLDAGVVTASMASFELQPMLQRLIEQFTPLADAKGLALELSCDRNLHVLTDEVLLERIVRNLLANAVRYTEHGRVTLAARSQTSQVDLTVADTGVGIAAEDLPRVFEEFFQVNNPSRDRSKGLGLGLAIVKRTADLLSMPLTLESTPGVGTICRLKIPAAEATGRADGVRPTDRVALNAMHVLAVDDDPQVSAGMKALLESLGCTVDLADSTEGAIEIASKRRPDLVLCDFRLPANDSGLTTIQALRRRHADLPAILITGDTAPDRLREAQAAGLLLLHKPIGAKELIAAINQACFNGEDQTHAD